MVPRTLRLPVELEVRFRDFCRQTRRDEPHTLREIVELFLADGIQAAEFRLTRSIWTSSDGSVGVLASAFERALSEAARATHPAPLQNDAVAPGQKKKDAS